MRVLIACECSGVVRRAFRDLGHDAWSCDLKSSEDDSPHHIEGDAIKAANLGCPIGSGRTKIYHTEWDIVIAHPPCDFLTVSGNRWFSDSAKAGANVLTGAARRRAQRDALAFVRALWDCAAPRVAIENPIGRLSTLWREPTQIIQPTHFGSPFRKATCLWLRGLPPLLPSHVKDGDWFAEPEPAGEQACWKMPPGPARKTDRSRTDTRIAEAMAEQWGGLAGKLADRD